MEHQTAGSSNDEQHNTIEVDSGCPLSAEPNEKRFDPKTLSMNFFKLINSSATQRLAIKVRCSNNDAYRVKPVYGFIEPSSQISLNVTRKADKPPRVDRLIIQYIVTKPQLPQTQLKPEAAELLFKALNTSDPKQASCPPHVKIVLNATDNNDNNNPPPKPPTEPKPTENSENHEKLSKDATKSNGVTTTKV